MLVPAPAIEAAAPIGTALAAKKPTSAGINGISEPRCFLDRADQRHLWRYHLQASRFSANRYHGPLGWPRRIDVREVALEAKLFEIANRSPKQERRRNRWRFVRNTHPHEVHKPVTRSGHQNPDNFLAEFSHPTETIDDGHMLESRFEVLRKRFALSECAYLDHQTAFTGTPAARGSIIQSHPSISA